MEKLGVISLKNRPYYTDCLQWNEDGQIAVCLDTNIHIITPMIISLNSREDSYKHVGLNLPEYKSTLQANAAADVNDIQTSLWNEEGYRCAIWSQTGLSKNQSCLLLVVTTKHRVLLYQSSIKDSVNSDWQLCMDLTDKVKEKAISHEYKTKINPHHTLYGNWSKRIMADPLASKLCLLALTNKAGDICIWSVTRNSADYINTISPHQSFVNLVQWSNWKNGSEPDTYIAYIVSSSTNGTVSLSSVKIKISMDEEKNTIIKDVQLSILKQWFNEGSAVTTLIRVQDDFNREATHVRIALCKGIQVMFISLPVYENEDIDVSKEWSSYCLQFSGLGLTGGDWLNDFDFRCYTVEGEGMVFHFNENDELEFDEDEHIRLSGKLVQKYKYQWMEEQGKAEDDDIIGASDARPYVFGATDSLSHIYTTFFFTMRPSIDVHYRPESLEEANLTFLLQKDRREEVDCLVKDIDTYVNDPNFLFTKPVRGIIRECLDYLIEDDYVESIERWFQKLIECMAPGPVFDEKDLTQAIYCESSTIASRIILNAEFEMKNYRLIVFENQFLKICKAAKEKTMTHFLSHVFHFALNHEFGEEDKMVLLLLADYGLNLGNDDLRKLCMDIYIKLQDKFKDLNLYPEIAYCNSPDGPFSLVAREKCPVCDEFVKPIGVGNLAQCGAGHFWELCSITRKVLHAPNTRKCINCDARSLQPSNDTSLTNIFLNHCCRCVYCGGGLLLSS